MNNGDTAVPMKERERKGMGSVPDARALPSQPLPGACGLSSLLGRLRSFLAEFIVFTANEHADLIALWIAHTYVLNAFEFTPYLNINSPLKRCGKSTLLDALKHLVARPWPFVSPSPAVLFRKIEADAPTLLWDEVDTVFSVGKGDEGKEDLRAVLNAGFQRGAKVPRCVGPAHKLAEFSVFCAKALAGIGTLPDTVADRSMSITLARAKPGQKPGRFRHREVAPRAEELRAALEAWAQGAGVLDSLRTARPDIPESLGDRQADIGEPLLAIADLAGGEWPQQARKALIKLGGTAGTTDDNISQKLLADVRDAFLSERADRLPTRDLLQLLVEREDAPWAQWWEADVSRGNVKGPASRLARLLRPFGVYSKKLREEGGKPVMGYLQGLFEDAFSSYLPNIPPQNEGTPEQ